MKSKKNKSDKTISKPLGHSDPAIPSDVLGSYTGVTEKNGITDEYEMPVQDADDL